MSYFNHPHHQHLQFNSPPVFPFSQQGEDLYNRWQEAKARHREEEHKLLKQKLVLQHKLIAAVDTLSHQRQVDLVKKQANVGNLTE